MQPVAVNRQARHDYFIEDRYEAGIQLLGCEVKSIREGKISLKESFVRLMKGEAQLINCHISKYSRQQGHMDLDPCRSRKLLLRKPELVRLATQATKKGYTIIPLSVYFKNGYAKVEIGVGRGKKQFDKRETIKKRIRDREADQAAKRFSRR